MPAEPSSVWRTCACGVDAERARAHPVRRSTATRSGSTRPRRARRTPAGSARARPGRPQPTATTRSAAAGPRGSPRCAAARQSLAISSSRSRLEARVDDDVVGPARGIAAIAAATRSRRELGPATGPTEPGEHVERARAGEVALAMRSSSRGRAHRPGEAARRAKPGASSSKPERGRDRRRRAVSASTSATEWPGRRELRRELDREGRAPGAPAGPQTAITAADRRARGSGRPPRRDGDTAAHERVDLGPGGRGIEHLEEPELLRRAADRRRRPRARSTRMPRSSHAASTPALRVARRGADQHDIGREHVEALEHVAPPPSARDDRVAVLDDVGQRGGPRAPDRSARASRAISASPARGGTSRSRRPAASASSTARDLRRAGRAARRDRPAAATMPSGSRAGRSSAFATSTAGGSNEPRSSSRADHTSTVDAGAEAARERRRLLGTTTTASAGRSTCRPPWRAPARPDSIVRVTTTPCSGTSPGTR